MRMGINAAWNNEAIACIDYLRRFNIQILADHRNLFVFDVDIGVVVIHRRDDPAILDEYAHDRFLQYGY